MLRFSYEMLTNSWFYGEWIVKIIAKVISFSQLRSVVAVFIEHPICNPIDSGQPLGTN